MNPDPDPAVLSWLDAQVAETLYLPATSLAALLVEIEVLPTEQRKEGLGAALTSLLANLLEARFMPFDHAAAAADAPLMVHARAAGRTISVADGQSAAGGPSKAPVGCCPRQRPCTVLGAEPGWAQTCG